MKGLMVVVLLMVGTRILNAQKLTGRWQEHSPEIAAGYLNNYQFLDDSTFLFNVSEFLGLTRIIGIGGRYTYNSKTKILSLVVEFSNEVVGGTIERSQESGEATDSWNITGGQTKRIKLPKPVKATIQVEFLKTASGGTPVALFDKIKYYMVD